MIEGKTTAGFCQLIVDPKGFAKILLEHYYPVWRTFEEAPDEMWEDLGRKFGLGHVCSVVL